MKTFKKGIESLKVPFFIMSMVIIFSFGFNAVSAADTAHVYVSPAGNDAWNGLAATHISSTTGPKKTIKSGVSAVRSGGVVKLASGTYYTTNVVISKSMNIQGAGSTKTVINGNYKGRIFTIKGVKVVISGVTFAKGKSTYGGAINNQGSLSVSHSKFQSNSCPNYGGAIFNGGNLSVYNVIFQGNRAYNGAGIVNDEGSTMNIVKSIFYGNSVYGSGSGRGYGGAIQNIGRGYLTSNVFSWNTGFEGGAIFNCGVLLVKQGNFRNNKATSTAGAIDTYHGVTSIVSSYFSGNRAGIFGGALYVDTDEGVRDTILSALTIKGCTFSGNTASKDGGTLHSYHGTVSISLSKFINNKSSRYGGAISNYYGILRLVSSVFTNNHAGIGNTIDQWK
jgi:predicted outer membrane repeat protein